jgi:PqqD family protein of HPr-rel-A system
MTASLPRAREDVEHVVLDGEAVVYDPVLGSVHHLNATATLVWQCCDGTGSIDDLVDDLAGAYDAPRPQIETDVRTLLADLESRALLVAPAGEERGDEVEAPADPPSP